MRWIGACAGGYVRWVMAVVAVAGSFGVGAAAANANVLLVGTYNGVAGQYSSIQAAVDAAQPGDTILVGPGDYKEQDDHTQGVQWDTPGGVVITTPDITIRGMDRNSVVVDGTEPGSPQCSSNPSEQDFGVNGQGRNGILVWKADNVSVENLTVCNFLAGSASGGTGNEIWWDGAAGSGQIGGHGFTGDYLNATSTFFGGEQTAAQYGIFSSDWSGGTWDNTYASNFNDSGYYIGACQQQCDQTVNHAWGEYNALGYSGSNSGGQMLIENSQFDNNEDGFDTNSQNGDNPPPQNGACPPGVSPPVAGAPTCWVFTHNNVHDNNNPNVPTAGSAAAGPVGTGMSIAGGRNDTVMDNTFSNNGAWGTIFVIYPDSGPPCTGGLTPQTNGAACIYDDGGNELLNNTYSHNGFFANPSNGDFAELTMGTQPSNCFSGNTEAGGGSATSSPTGLEAAKPCNGAIPPAPGPDPDPVFTDEVACDSTISLVGLPPNFSCPPNANYPRQDPSKIAMHPLPDPSQLPTMPNPCADVPTNAWCPTS
jgi:hypothetical protein